MEFVGFLFGKIFYVMLEIIFVKNFCDIVFVFILVLLLKCIFNIFVGGDFLVCFCYNVIVFEKGV